MGTLYIDRRDMELGQDAGRLVLRRNGSVSGAVPLSHLERVVVCARASIDTGALGLLAEQGVGLVVINPRKPGRTAILPGRAHNDVARRLAQYRLSLDPAWRTRFSAMLVRRKLRGQQGLLQEMLAARPDQRYRLHNAIEALNERLRQLAAGPGSLDRARIRGLEGAAAAAYFRGFGSVFPPLLRFTGRNRRPPRDPVNACLSLAYTLLHADAVLAIHRAGLDPLLGFYHDPSFARESLACDLVEPLRPHADRWVWQQFRDRILRADDFHRDGDACLLGKAGRKRFYEHWEPDAGALRRRLERYARLLARMLRAAPPAGEPA